MYLKCDSFCLRYKVAIVIVGRIVWFPFGYGNGYQTFLFSISSYEVKITVVIFQAIVFIIESLSCDKRVHLRGLCFQ